MNQRQCCINNCLPENAHIITTTHVKHICQIFASSTAPCRSVPGSRGAPAQEEECSIQKHASLVAFQRIVADAKACKKLLLSRLQFPGAPQHLQCFTPQLLLTLLSSQTAQMGAQDLRACKSSSFVCHKFSACSQVTLTCYGLQHLDKYKSYTHLNCERQPAAACHNFWNQCRCVPSGYARCKGPSPENLHIMPLGQ